VRLTRLPRKRLANLPTPLVSLDRLSHELGGPELWVKRDDLTGIGMGGNKLRKLEFIIGRALEEGADLLVTTGGVQSNHARQTAAAAAASGLDCVLVLSGQAGPAEGNLLLDYLFGAEVIFTDIEDWDEREALLREVADSYAQRGRRPYVIPVGGYSLEGIAAYVSGFLETWNQCLQLGIDFDAIYLASGSGGTQAGLAAGAAVFGQRVEVYGVDVVPEQDGLERRVRDGARDFLDRAGYGTGDLAMTVVEGYGGPAYGIPDEATWQAIELVARAEGLVLDPVYSGKAMAALIDHIRDGRWGRGHRVLFWMTGGQPALFTFTDRYRVIRNTNI